MRSTHNGEPFHITGVMFGKIEEVEHRLGLVASQRQLTFSKQVLSPTMENFSVEYLYIHNKNRNTKVYMCPPKMGGTIVRKEAKPALTTEDLQLTGISKKLIEDLPIGFIFYPKTDILGADLEDSGAISFKRTD